MGVEHQIAAVQSELERLQEVRRRRHAALLGSLLDEAKQLEALGELNMNAGRPQYAGAAFREALGLVGKAEWPLDNTDLDELVPRLKEREEAAAAAVTGP